MDRDLLDQLVEQGSALGVGGFVSDAIEVEGCEQVGGLLEACRHVVVALDFGLVPLDVGAQSVDAGVEACLFFAGQFGGEVSVVVCLQQLAALFEQVLQRGRRGVRRLTPALCARLTPALCARLTPALCAPCQLLADRFLEGRTS